MKMSRLLHDVMVPFLLVSPFAKRHYVSHVIHDHASILKFIETRFNLPALSRRDANADAMLDLFEMGHPDFSVPRLPKPTIHGDQAIQCLLRQGDSQIL